MVEVIEGRGGTVVDEETVQRAAADVAQARAATAAKAAATASGRSLRQQRGGPK